MSSRAIYDSNAAYRERTERMSNSPSFTFSCGMCKQFCGILGRKAMPSPGKRRIWKCAQCAGAQK